MNTVRRRLAAQAIALATVAAVPVAVSPRWGWIASAALVAAAVSAIVRAVSRELLDPLERLSSLLATDAKPTSPSQVAMQVITAYGDCLQRCEAAVSDALRRERLMESAFEGIVLLDPHAAVEHANPQARLLLGSRVTDSPRQIGEPQLERLIAEAVRSQILVEREVILRTPAPRHVLARAIPMGADGVVLLLRDLAESVRIDRIRRDFVANVSHELKTPVASLRALSDVAATALGDGDMATAANFVQRMARESVRLSDLVNDLLDLSRVEARIDALAEDLDLHQLIEEAVALLRPVAEAKGLALLASGGPVHIFGDRVQLATAVGNLLENAIRYSETGTVRISVESANGWASMSVTDEGIGIPSQDLPRVFERFYRVNRARTRTTGGTGLGLSIVRHVVENHGGRIDVTSSFGEGTTFVVRIPHTATPDSLT